MEFGAISVPLELKFAVEGGSDPVGSFEGYGAAFNNVDRGGDLIEPGAFAKSLSETEIQGANISMYYNHDRSAGAIGKWDKLSEDKNGLYVKGRIAVDTVKGSDVYKLAKMGAIGGLSIGYSIPPGGYRRGSGKNGEPSRYLKQVSLREISIVDDPMNTAAKVAFLKSANAEAGVDIEIKTIRDFETALRDVFGWSRAKARAVAEHGFKSADQEVEAEIKDAVSGLSRLEQFLKTASQKNTRYTAEERRRMADSGAAMSDGSFPIKDLFDLRDAVGLWGNGKDPAAAKRHIIKRARELGLVDKLPESWGISK